MMWLVAKAEISTLVNPEISTLGGSCKTQQTDDFYVIYNLIKKNLKNHSRRIPS